MNHAHSMGKSKTSNATHRKRCVKSERSGCAHFASQTAMSIVNNGGDIGKTLEQLGSDESIKNLLTTMVTAGALDALGNSMTVGDVKLKDITSANSSLGANIGKNIINNVANAVITSALTGASLEDGIQTAITSALISAGAGAIAGSIGDLTANDQVFKALAHALAGCVAGAAGSGAQGCNSGATGAVIGELAAQWYDNPPGSKSPQDVLNFVKVISAAAGALTGDGSAQSVNTAVITGTNAAQNNYLAHAERQKLTQATKDCYGGNASACSTMDALQRKDELSDKLLANAVASCKGSECNDVSNFIRSQQTALGCGAANACPDDTTLQKYWNVSQAKAQGLEPVYPEGWVLDAKAALDLGKFGVKLVSGASTGAAGSLEALGQLAKTDASKITNNFYAEGSNPAYWTNGKPGDASLNLATHWEKHGAEFSNFNSANDYYKGATSFVTTPPPGTLIKTAPNGDVLLYNPATNTFGVRTADGLPRTMFKLDPTQHGYSSNIDFWNAK